MTAYAAISKPDVGLSTLSPAVCAELYKGRLPSDIRVPAQRDPTSLNNYCIAGFTQMAVHETEHQPVGALGYPAFLSPRPFLLRRDLGHRRFPCCAVSQQPAYPSAAKASRRSLHRLDLPDFDSVTATRANTPSLTRRNPSTLQVNIGLTCNLACRHCHVESSPSRTETMSATVAERLLELAASQPQLRTVDLTGGAPELHGQFRRLVSGFRALGLQVLDRCNLTVLEEPSQEDLVPFLAKHQAKVIASLPCYTVENVEKQRGNGVFDDSIRALMKLNAAGYGIEGSGLELDLVYNPVGPSLPPPQQALEDDYRQELRRVFGIEFTNLICITNMPIKRFADDLLLRGQLKEYMELLVASFNPQTVESVMCRDMVHVAWDGRIYDCDFNYALEMALPVANRKRDDLPVPLPSGLTIFDIDALSDLTSERIRTGFHCFGCTAGQGSSCGGSLS